MNGYRAITLLATLLVALLAPQRSVHAADDLAGTPRSQRVFGGSPVGECGWPTVVSLGNCTGTLIHPEIVVYAAHCGADREAVGFGSTASGAEWVPVDHCRTNPDFAEFGTGDDFAYCKLARPVEDFAIVPPLGGCETDLLQAGQDVTLVGFGYDDEGGFGTKRSVDAAIGELRENGEFFAGGEGRDTCNGDSGGPVFVRLPSDQGWDGSWRVAGITSFGPSYPNCGPGGWYTMMHRALPWIEASTGIDVTPCQDADGAWTGGPGCTRFPNHAERGEGTWAEGCAPQELSARSPGCGGSVPATRDSQPPHVDLLSPDSAESLASEPDAEQTAVTFEVEADDAGGTGVKRIEIEVDGHRLPDAFDSLPPYEITLALPRGVHRVVVEATDRAGNSSTSEPVVFGIGVSDEELRHAVAGMDLVDRDGALSCSLVPGRQAGTLLVLVPWIAARRRRGR